MRRAHAIRLGVTAALALSAAGAVHGYVTYASWPTSVAVFYVNPANADVSASHAIAGVQAGMDVWNHAGTPFRVNYGGTVSDTAIKVDNRNVVIFRPNYSRGSTIASTYTWRDGNNKLLDADVTFYTTDWTFHVGTTGCSGGGHIYIEDVAAHEFGHAIGMNHSSVTDATMYPAQGRVRRRGERWRRTISMPRNRSTARGRLTLPRQSPSPIRPMAQALRQARPSRSPVPRSTLRTGTSAAACSGPTTAPRSSRAHRSRGSALDTPGQHQRQSPVDRQRHLIGQGASFSRVLTAGTHTIVARATDSGGMQGVASGQRDGDFYARHDQRGPR